MNEVSTSTRYTSKNEPPPSFAARYGNRHRLPTPTALPAAARTNPICPEKLLAFFSMILKLLSVFPVVI